MSSVAPFKGLVEFSSGFSPRPQVSHVVFDFDGTLSWLRHGWPEIMVQLFQEHLPGQTGEAARGLHELLLDDVLSLNGKASIHQMHRGVERLREHGGKPPSPEALLQEYQRRLDAIIEERTEAILSGRARPDEFVVHGGRSFLEGLSRRGLTLVILSGTAEHRVKEEAELLGLARYFGAHIYGGTADAAQSSKRAVIGRLLSEERVPGEHLLSFGDGPVETQLTKEAGGMAVAVASDEEQNGSGRMQPQKRKLLTAAGADAVIPDYRDATALIETILNK
jgi:phosphoglycolate phosphatase-like HAD superfamily hydrolase